MELHRRSFSKRLDTGRQARLRIENRNGYVNIRTHDEPTILIDVVAEVYAGSSKEADAEAGRIQAAITQDGDRVTIRTPDQQRPEYGLFFFGRGPRVDYDIRVPAGTEVWASCRNGPLQLTGTRRGATIEGRNGRVIVEDVSGELSIDDRNGRVQVTRCSGPLRISGANGRIAVEKVQQAITIETRNGTVEVNDAGAAVTATAANGALRFSGPIAGDITMEAANGSIRLLIPADSRFEIDAESRHGSVRSDLPVRARPAAEAPGPVPKVRLRTSNGSIRLSEL